MKSCRLMLASSVSYNTLHYFTDLICSQQGTTGYAKNSRKNSITFYTSNFLSINEDQRKFFKTGEAKLHPEHYLIKCVGGQLLHHYSNPFCRHIAADNLAPLNMLFKPGAPGFLTLILCGRMYACVCMCVCVCVCVYVYVHLRGY